MKKILLYCGFFLLFTALCQQAFAHVLQTDGTIGAVLHIDPEDDPIVGKPATFYFELKDTSGKFSPSRCDCTAKILQSDKTLFSKDGFSNTFFTFTFPERSLYTLVLHGTPRPGQGPLFQPFTLTYSLRVDREEAPSNASAPGFFSLHIIHLILVGGIFVWAFGRFFIDRHRAKKKNALP